MKTMLGLFCLCLMMVVPVTIYLLLNPETFWQRFSAIFIGLFLLGAEVVALAICGSRPRNNGELDKESSQLRSSKNNC